MMTLSRTALLAGWILFCLPRAVVADPGNPGKSPPSVRVLSETLDENLDVKDFTNPTTFKEALGALKEKLQRRGKVLPIRIDRQAFLDENPDAPDMIGHWSSAKRVVYSRRNSFRSASSSVCCRPSCASSARAEIGPCRN